MKRLHDMLVAYGEASDQIYSLSKSKVYFSSKVHRAIRHHMRRKTEILEGTLPFTYLDVPIFRGVPKVEHLLGLADYVIAKFDRWKGHTLSLAGRRCLINSVISVSLVHSMMVYKWPRPLIKRVEVAMRNFLWFGNVNKKGIIRVAWARCCPPV